jgi:hypothetical protein
MVISLRWTLLALALPAAGCVGGDSCADLSDEEAKDFATKGLRGTFARRRPRDMLGPYQVDQLQALKVERHDYGRGHQMTHIASISTARRNGMS